MKSGPGLSALERVGKKQREFRLVSISKFCMRDCIYEVVLVHELSMVIASYGTSTTEQTASPIFYLVIVHVCHGTSMVHKY